MHFFPNLLHSYVIEVFFQRGHKLQGMYVVHISYLIIIDEKSFEKKNQKTKRNLKIFFKIEEKPTKIAAFLQRHFEEVSHKYLCCGADCRL